MFVTWRYVALRTFTLRCDAPRFGPRSLGQRSRKKRTALWEGKKSSGAVEKFSRRSDEMKGKEEKQTEEKTEKGRERERDERTESPKVFCFAVFSRNFYDYRLSGSPSARISLLGLHEEPRTTCGFTTFTFKRLLAAILVTAPNPIPSSPPPFSAHLHLPSRFYVPARIFLCSHFVDRVQIYVLFLISTNTGANLALALEQ